MYAIKRKNILLTILNSVIIGITETNKTKIRKLVVHKQSTTASNYSE